MTTPDQWYKGRLTETKQLKETAVSRRKAVSWLRLIVFMGGVVAIYVFAAQKSVVGVWISSVLTVVVFFFLLKWFLRLRENAARYSAREIMLQRELDALRQDYSGFDGGKEFADPEHEYAGDIDLFGESSVFQLLNRTTTVGGKEKLARWCMNPELDKVVLEQRQQAVAALANDPEFRIRLQTCGHLSAMTTEDLDKLERWTRTRAFFNRRRFIILPVLFSVLSVAGIILAIAGIVPVSVLFLYVALGPYTVTGIYLKKINEQHQYLSRSASLLSRYQQVFEHVGSFKTKSDYIAGLGDESGLFHRAPVAMKKLSRITSAVDTRLNLLVGFILNGLFLWDIIQMVRLERWKAEYGSAISKWFDNVAVIDALASLAGFAYNSPDFVFPEITDSQDQELYMEDAGHPLIPAAERVGNTFGLSQEGQFVIVTGANMAGKSTFLRTVAVNMMLAMTGTVVCAKAMKIKPVQLITSLRTTDNLVRSESYFFAELKRLKWIIDRLNSGEQLMIILDEILKGTNSRDKQEGSRALVEQFVRLKATGIIATHDILLGALAEQYPGNVVNRCFEVSIKDNTLVFDYTLRQGISQNMNATFLMKTMGITV